MSNATEVRVGQIYASTHKQDVKAGVRQAREVVEVHGEFAWFKSEGHRRASRVRVLPTGRIPGHRLVAEASR